MKFKHLSLLIIFLWPTLVVADQAAEMKNRIEQQQKAPDRHKWDMRRDAARKPFEMFTFLSLKPGM